MTDNLIGKRVRATLGENVLVGTVSTEMLSTADVLELTLDHGTHVILSLDWTIEPLPDPLPTAPYSLVVPPADDPSSYPFVLLPAFAKNCTVWTSTGPTENRTTEQMLNDLIRDHGWRVIPGPAD